jgi:hypothetical protein
MTAKIELLATAKKLGIKGRHEMKVVDLTAAIAAFSNTRKLVVRKGQNLSGNQPYVAKVYHVGRIIHADELANEPKQVQTLIRFMADTKIEGRGEDIVRAATKAGVLKTKIKDPRALFGYYAKRLQNYGATAKYAA